MANKKRRMHSKGKYERSPVAVKNKKPEPKPREPITWKNFRMPCWAIPAALFLVELFGFVFLILDTPQGMTGAHQWMPLALGLIWSLLLTGLLRLLPALAARICFGIGYFLMVAYAVVQTGYYRLFNEMMWISDFRYASEGSDYFSVLLKYPLGWYLSIALLLALGVILVWKFPRRKEGWYRNVLGGVAAAALLITALSLPKTVFAIDRTVKYAVSDYGRAQSLQAAYENMFNTHRLYQVCGLHQTLVKDIYENSIYPITPGYLREHAQAEQTIDDYFAQRTQGGDNAMTGLFEGKNVVLVLMESMDDWALGEHTPTINRLMEEGINFTNFYTPAYGGVRTFNSEFCINTGSFLSSRGGYAFDYVTNDFRQSLASLLTKRGYSSKVYHYNDPGFYSRNVFSKAMGYDEYVCYADYVPEEKIRDLYDDQFLFNYGEVSDSFFREGQKLNFIITRSAHLSYVYNEVLSHWALQKYPQYRGMTGHEEEDCMYLKARLIDDLFARLLQELEAKGELENTVIVAVTDHYTYGVNDEQLVLDRSGVDDMLLVEKTPCFIWSAGCEAVEVDKTLNTSDLLPTVLNLMGIDSPYSYLGRDAFDDTYRGYALFPNGSWVCDGVAYNASSGRTMILEPGKTADETMMEQMAQLTEEYVYINNLILKSDYYAGK